MTHFPAVFLEKEKILVIADLHLGIEAELLKSGIKIPSQAKKFTELINKLHASTEAKHLIIVGDVKHEVPGISYRELKEIPEFFEQLKGIFKKISIVKGNHDTYLERLLPKDVRLYSSRGFKIKRFGFFHGHAWPAKELMSCDWLFMGHVHPTIHLEDKFGYRVVEPVWVRGKISSEKIKRRYIIQKLGKLEIAILPASNRLLGGTPVNNVERGCSKLLGPLLRRNLIDMSNLEIYLLDGTYLGKSISIIKAENYTQ